MYNNIDEVRRAHVAGEKLKFLFFWGHTPAPDGHITQSCLSQWWHSDFTVDGVKYSSAEQYMMAGKARLFGDGLILAEIMAAYDPKTIKALGQKVCGFSEEIWKQHRFEIVKAASFAKFGQNKALKDFLLSSGDKILVEASPYDRIWGIGMSASSEKINNPAEWRGQNLLGFALMAARDELRATVK